MNPTLSAIWTRIKAGERVPVSDSDLDALEAYFASDAVSSEDAEYKLFGHLATLANPNTGPRWVAFLSVPTDAQTMTPRKLTADEVEFTVECLPEDVPIEGNALASGDEEEDRLAEQWIRDQLNNGNEWAWCTVKVTARWKDFEGVAYLGCCSYKSKADFLQPGEYYDDMKDDALDDLNETIANTAKQLPT